MRSRAVCDLVYTERAFVRRISIALYVGKDALVPFALTRPAVDAYQVWAGRSSLRYFRPPKAMPA